MSGTYCSHISMCVRRPGTSSVSGGLLMTYSLQGIASAITETQSDRAVLGTIAKAERSWERNR